MIAGFGFVQFLSSLQTGMIRWIVDEDTLLSDDEHRDIVSLSLADITKKMNSSIILDHYYLLCISGQTGTSGT